MRTIIIAAVALLAGLVIGSLGPREELREAQARIDQLEKEVASKGKRARLAQGFLNLPRRQDTRWEDEPEPTRAPRPVAQDSGATPAAEATPGPAGAEAGEGTWHPEDKAERLEQARTALELRRAQARAALLERADLDDRQLEDFDAAVARMNDGLEDIAADVAVYVQENREPNRREAMHLASDVLDVLLEADDTFGSILSEEQYRAAGEDAVDPLSHIDPALIDILQEL